MRAPTLEHCIEGLERSHVIFDANYLIDAFRSIGGTNGNSSPFLEFNELLKTHGITRSTIYPALIEVYKASSQLDEWRDKKNILDTLLDSTLPITEATLKGTDLMMQLYRSDGKRLSPTDFFLAGTLAQYHNNPNLYILTRDHDDFIMKVFDRERVIVLHEEKGGIYPYALIKYSAEKVLAIKELLVGIDARRNQPS